MDKVSTERLRELIARHEEAAIGAAAAGASDDAIAYYRAGAAALRELLAIRAEVEAQRPTHEDEAQRVAQEIYGVSLSLDDPWLHSVAAAIRREREVAAARELALKAERDEAIAAVDAANRDSITAQDRIMSRADAAEKALAEWQEAVLLLRAGKDDGCRWPERYQRCANNVDCNCRPLRELAQRKVAALASTPAPPQEAERVPYGVCDLAGHDVPHWRREHCENWHSVAAPPPAQPVGSRVALHLLRRLRLGRGRQDNSDNLPEVQRNWRHQMKTHDEVVEWAQALLTALNVGDVARGSPLHLKLRAVMIAYRESLADGCATPPPEVRAALRRLIWHRSPSPAAPWPEHDADLALLAPLAEEPTT